MKIRAPPIGAGFLYEPHPIVGAEQEVRGLTICGMIASDSPSSVRTTWTWVSRTTYSMVPKRSVSWPTRDLHIELNLDGNSVRSIAHPARHGLRPSPIHNTGSQATKRGPRTGHQAAVCEHRA